jgi:pyrroloquinoline-quinone synthase
MLDRNVFKEALRQELQRHLTLSHPIFRHLLDAKNPDLALLRKVTLQGYQLTRHFLDYVEHLFVYCPLPRHKTVLLYNLFEEETGHLSKTDNHVTLMQNFIRALGISDAERDAVVPLPATRELVEYRLAAVRDPARYHVGAAAVLIASEGQNLETAGGTARHELLEEVYGLSPFDVQFFSVHQKEDVGHVEQGLNLVSDYCDSAQMQQEALEAVRHTCELFYAMYENMYQAYCSPQAPCEPALAD